MNSYNFQKLCNSDRLSQEIQQSNIVVALDHIETNSNPESTVVWFKAELSLTDETTLNDLVEEHVNEPLEENLPQEVAIVADTSIPKDADGAPIQRVKMTSSGWHYQLHGIEFETSRLNGIQSKKVDNSNYGFATEKFYELINNVETEITGENLNQGYLDTNCIKTIIDWEPNHDIEMLGGALKQLGVPTEDVRVWVVGVPDVPENYGGSKPFVVNMNLKYLTGEGIRVDGRSAKYLTYNANNHTSKIRLIFRHPAGHKHKLLMVFELFKA